jgi:phytoene dehydrogenase-like protein
MVSDRKHVLDLIYMPAPYDYFIRGKKEDYIRLKEDVSEKLIKAAEGIIPDLSKYALVKDVSTPLTYERYTDATKGGWYDIDCSPKQALLGRIRNKTPIKGLYLTGAKTLPGSGMFGAINAGLLTADAILRGKLTHGKMLLKIQYFTGKFGFWVKIISLHIELAKKKKSKTLPPKTNGHGLPWGSCRSID